MRAARAHLARRYGTGVEALLWEARRYPLPDVDAVRKTIAAIRGGRAVPSQAGDEAGRARDDDPDSMDLGAALVVLEAARLDLDRLEIELIDAVRGAGLEWAAIAAVLDLPDADAAERRYEKLRPRLDAPVDHVDHSGPLEPS